MGIQDIQDVTLIRHAYVRRAKQNQGKLYFDSCFSKIHCLWAPLSVNEDVGTTFKKDLENCIAYMKHPFRRWKLERGFKKVMETFRTFESCIRILYSLLRLQNEI